MRPYEIFREVEPAIVIDLFSTFRDEDRDVYKSALASLAQERKLRPVFVQRKSVTDQIAWMHKTLKLRGSDTVAEHLLQVWFMKFQQPLLIKFCDGMGIEHNGEGSVEGSLPEELDAEKLSETVNILYAEFNPLLVSLYLHLFNLQRAEGWKVLEALLSDDDRVRLKTEPEASADAENGSGSEPATGREPELDQEATLKASDPEDTEPEGNGADQVATDTD